MPGYGRGGASRSSARMAVQESHKEKISQWGARDLYLAVRRVGITERLRRDEMGHDNLVKVSMGRPQAVLEELHKIDEEQARAKEMADMVARTAARSG